MTQTTFGSSDTLPTLRTGLNANFDELYATSAERLITETVVGVAVSSITFSSIAATYRDLRLVIRSRGTVASVTCRPRLQMNADTGNNYDWSHRFIAAATGGEEGGTGVAFMELAIFPGASATAGFVGAAEARIFNYRDTSLFKTITGQSFGSNGTAYCTIGGGQWKSASAITSLTLILDAGNFAIGTVASLYGIL
jgi:hypothetical protein